MFIWVTVGGLIRCLNKVPTVITATAEEKNRGDGFAVIGTSHPPGSRPGPDALSPPNSARLSSFRVAAI